MSASGAIGSRLSPRAGGRPGRPRRGQLLVVGAEGVGFEPTGTGVPRHFKCDLRCLSPLGTGTGTTNSAATALPDATGAVDSVSSESDRGSELPLRHNTSTKVIHRHH